MKIKNEIFLINNGAYFNADIAKPIRNDIYNAIQKSVWPIGSTCFSINPTQKGNGVKPIKTECMNYLKKRGWFLEKNLDTSLDNKAGALDAVFPITGKVYFAVEWETGNISSAHRAMNKICLGILNGTLLGGTLILPSRAMYKYLTDRVANYQEISPYLKLWRNLNTENCYLSVIEVEHDNEDISSPLIPKGTDGWANFSSLL